MIGRVYKIVSDTMTDIIYVGSTTVSLSKRFAQHKCDQKTTIGKYLAVDNDFHIELIKEYEVADTKNLRAYEQLWINKLTCVNNNSTFCTTPNKVKYLMNRDKILKEASIVCMCECGLTYTKAHGPRHKKTRRHQKALDQLK